MIINTIYNVRYLKMSKRRALNSKKLRRHLASEIVAGKNTKNEVNMTEINDSEDNA